MVETIIAQTFTKDETARVALRLSIPFTTASSAHSTVGANSSSS